jgi:hypothetical protein
MKLSLFIDIDMAGVYGMNEVGDARPITSGGA